MSTGKLIRVSALAVEYIEKFKDDHYWSYGKALDAALSLDAYGLKGWILPSDVHRTRKEASVEAMKRGAHKGLALEEIETPVKMSEV
jgi:hypothetical protein